ncbi:hypothetical protein G1K75_09485 [Tenacibaculum finnmarkense]|uniref:hypothetical protein n=1 Tax=Tenacibaculum finnmarkense TaxID=2781243 RepID=UPI0011AF3618|nr:hypothetical protein [Tenacibaculum finnmarkense]MCD8405803.1 hypothetical protein [Tenacibaculum dicentrarchi]MCG8208183.1 hypothetical protein [Tenacibaculum finnmarkense genomovar finnmarkense]MCG8742510.1 hypothetical protein [Tenacibaculum finnmarkense]MCG8760899.1 hypothetical protein [Tenacibaculum finnmarkense]MCG8765910.1 hypothetical protein [Tenacibaculum finnmarkense]
MILYQKHFKPSKKYLKIEFRLKDNHFLKYENADIIEYEEKAIEIHLFKFSFYFVKTTNLPF